MTDFGRLTLHALGVLVLLSVGALPAAQEPSARSRDDRSSSHSEKPAPSLEAGRFLQAEQNGRLANEAFERCQRYVNAWLNHADPATGLIPRGLKTTTDYWNGRDAGADNYAFMVLTAAMIDRPLLDGKLLDLLRTEIRLTSRLGRLPDDYSFTRKGWRREQVNLDEIIFEGAEYVKDGLLYTAEWMGPSPWSDRMIGIIDDIWKHAAIETPFGRIPTLNFEVNGDLLQASSRLFWFTGQDKYLEWAIRLGDYYLLGTNHPTRHLRELRLRDHGCEVINGLTELYLTAKHVRPQHAAAYHQPLHELFDRILESGRNEHGMLYDSFNPQTGAHSQGICDTWGYNYDGLYTLFLLDHTSAYRDAVLKALGNLQAHYRNYPWEGQSADGYADSIEGAINLCNREPVASAMAWIDSEIQVMWAKQQADGIIEGWHGDGNFARTSLMYALWKTQGITVQPWRCDVRFGAVRAADGKVYLSLSADQPWEGRIIFDRPRHRDAMHLPLDYPRINQFPEWFTVDADRRYAVSPKPASSTVEVDGRGLLAGFPVALRPGNKARMTVEALPSSVKACGVRAELDGVCARIPQLGWDTEEGGRSATNLLRRNSSVMLRINRGGQWIDAADLPVRVQDLARGWLRYRLPLDPATELRWDIKVSADDIDFKFQLQGEKTQAAGQVELVFPFDPRVTPTTVLPKTWRDDGRLELPAIISAPDFGQMLITCRKMAMTARLEGSRAQHAVDLVVELPRLVPGRVYDLELEPVRLPAPAFGVDSSLWRAARRGWFGAFQPSARWGDAGNPFSAPAGMLANNVVSDPASCSLWFYADQAFFTPELAPGVSIMTLVRRTLDWWLEHKMLPDGEMICYWDKAHFLDANASPLIAAWDYCEATHDRAWLARQINHLEKAADYLAARDVDHDGLVEAIQSGVAGTLQEPARSCSWWDALNCGHKDAYSNALIYRAWRCLATLEASLNRREQHDRYRQLADRLKAAYSPTLLNPQTGWLAWWKSADGVLHDYAAPTVNGLAIEYGLIEPPAGREILARLRHKLDEVDFHRFDLGVPPMLVPVLRNDYLLPDAAGCPKREDGTDTFGYYMNGGITAGHVLHFLMAHYVVGEGSEADRILRAMLARQARGGFQNGAVNDYPKGVDWTTWDGQPAGYEGYLADSFRFLQAVVLRELPARLRFYQPLSDR
jgi:hypothetical protein